MSIEISRREFIFSTILFTLSSSSGCIHKTISKTIVPTKTDGIFNIWLNILGPEKFELGMSQAEMGQHTWHGYSIILAEELEVPLQWISPVSVSQEFCQDTGGSSSIRSHWQEVGHIGANIRETFKLACAKNWGVETSQIQINNGYFFYKKQTCSYLDLLELAKQVKQTKELEKPQLKHPKDYKLIGKTNNDVNRNVDKLKLQGGFVYGLDAHPENMAFANVIVPPRLGMKFDKITNLSQLKKNQAIIDVVSSKQFVAIVAENYHVALVATSEANWQWSEIPEITQALKDQERRVKKIEYDYYAPFLAHATMGPIGATIHYNNKEWHIWADTQSTSYALEVLKDNGFSKVILHPCLVSGGFGRKLEVDYILHACELYKAGMFSRPVTFRWSREMDMVDGYFRPRTMIKFQPTFSQSGKMKSWKCKLYGSSILKCIRPKVKLAENEIDPTTTMGLDRLPYKLPKLEIEFHDINRHIPVGFFRSVGGTQNSFFVESFINEWAMNVHKNKDPLEFRLELTNHHPRAHKVLQKLKTLSNWNNGKTQGVALVELFGSIVGMVAHLEDSIDLKVNRIDVVADLGMVIDPQSVHDQIQGGVIFALSACLFQQTTIENGSVIEQNFDQYPLLTMAQTPIINIEIIQHDLNIEMTKPGGAGEPGVPPVAASVAMAYSKIINKKITSMPFVKT